MVEINFLLENKSYHNQALHTNMGLALLPIIREHFAPTRALSCFFCLSHGMFVVNTKMHAFHAWLALYKAGKGKTLHTTSLSGRSVRKDATVKWTGQRDSHWDVASRYNSNGDSATLSMSCNHNHKTPGKTSADWQCSRPPTIRTPESNNASSRSSHSGYSTSASLLPETRWLDETSLYCLYRRKWRSHTLLI